MIEQTFPHKEVHTDDSHRQSTQAIRTGGDSYRQSTQAIHTDLTLGPTYHQKDHAIQLIAHSKQNCPHVQIDSCENIRSVCQVNNPKQFKIITYQYHLSYIQAEQCAIINDYMVSLKTQLSSLYFQFDFYAHYVWQIIILIAQVWKYMFYIEFSLDRTNMKTNRTANLIYNMRYTVTLTLTFCNKQSDIQIIDETNYLDQAYFLKARTCVFQYIRCHWLWHSLSTVVCARLKYFHTNGAISLAIGLL